MIMNISEETPIFAKQIRIFMERLYLDSNILLTMISINMTIIGLTSLAEKKTIIGVDYGKYLINKYKLFHVIPLYVLLILFAVINTAALFTLYWTDSQFCFAIFIGVTVCLSFAIYYFFGFILRENPAVKRQLYENEFIGLYYKDGTPPGAECDKIVGMNSGNRTSKRLSSDVVTYFDKFNNDTQKAFEESFGPESFIYKRNSRIRKKYLKLTGHEPYDYTGEDRLVHISWEFFQLYRWSELQEKWIMEILVLFNDKYAAGSPKMKLNNLIRVFFHINTFGKTENMFGYRVMDYLFKYIKDTYSCICKPYADRVEKEAALLKYYCNYIYTCINDHYSEQSFKLAVSQFRELIGMCGIEGHIEREQMVRIMLAQSAYHSSVEVERLATAAFNQYLFLTAPESAMTLDEARGIISKEREEKATGQVSRKDLFSAASAPAPASA